MSGTRPLIGPAATDAVRRADALDPKFRSHLRFVEHDDAAYVWSLRTDASLNRYLSASAADVAAQREWIERYKAREAEGVEFYFVVVSEGADRGLIRMYGFKEIGGLPSFCWGSWIIPPPRPPGLVTFSAITMYELGFDTLGFPRAHFDVVKENAGVIAFHLRAGAEPEGEDGRSFHYRYTPSAYAGFREASEAQIRRHREISLPLPPR